MFLRENGYLKQVGGIIYFYLIGNWKLMVKHELVVSKNYIIEPYHSLKLSDSYLMLLAQEGQNAS